MTHDTPHTPYTGSKQQRMAQVLLKMRLFFVVLLLALLPFHALIATTAKPLIENASLFNLLMAWKEILAIAVLGLMTAEICFDWATFKRKKLDFLDKILITYALLALTFGFFQNTSLTQWVFGIRISLLPFLFVLLGRHVQWPSPEKLIRIVLIAGLITGIFGILQATVLPPEWLASLGYSLNTYIEVPGAGLISTGTTSAALSSCPLLEHSSSFCRAISTFGGPTRFGVYLLVIIGLLLALFLDTKKANISKVSIVLITMTAAILTFSRSVWLGLIGMIGLWSLMKWGKKALIAGLAGVLIVGAVGVFAFTLKDSAQHQNPLKSILTRSGSTSKHAEYLKNGLTALQNNPLGLGVGTVGPAADRYTPFLTENWFLQIFVEMGFLGGAVFLAFMGALFRALYKTKTPLSHGVLLGLIGVCVAGLFTHSFEELAASYTLMILAGAALKNGQ